MEFKDELKKYTERLENIKDTLQTEEATKMSLIVPFFQLLLRKIQMQNGQFWRKNWKIFYPRQKEWEKCGCSL